MAAETTIRLNTGASLPAIGLGTWLSTGADAKQAVLLALKAGYRHIDTAAAYGNEAAIGEAIRESGVPRSDIFVTTKVWSTWLSRTEDALNLSLEALGIGYIDLWLMHWPVVLNPKGNDPKFPKRPDGSPDYEQNWDFLDTWRAMEALYKKYPDKIKAIGVSNFSTVNLEKLLQVATVVPAANQVELHPSLPQDKLVSYCQSKNIAVVGYCPLGSPQSSLLSNPTLLEVAAQTGMSPAQCLISWGVQSGWAVVPKSASEKRIKENLQSGKLSKEAMETIRSIGQSAPKRYIDPGWAIGIWHDDAA